MPIQYTGLHSVDSAILSKATTYHLRMQYVVIADVPSTLQNCIKLVDYVLSPLCAHDVYRNKPKIQTALYLQVENFLKLVYIVP